MRILCATPYYDPEGGGLERYAHEILSRLVRDGHQVKVVSSTRSGLGDEERDGVRVVRGQPRLFLGNAPIDHRLPARFREELRRFRPDVVVGHTPVPFSAEVAYRAARSGAVPFVATYHAGRLRGSSIALDSLARAHRSTFERPMLNGSARLIAASDYVRDHALRRHRPRVTVVPPGVDTRRFVPPEGMDLPRRVLFVGPLSRTYQWKGVDVLWQAFKRVQRRFPDAELTMVGDGDRRQRFIAKAKKEGLRLRAPGRVAPERLVQEYQRAGVAVLPSINEAESFGMVLAEANACGLPVVASAVGGIPGFVKHRDNGLLAAPGDAHDLADRITQVLLDPEEGRRMGRAGREKVCRNHDWDQLARQTHRVLEAATAGDDLPSSSPEERAGGQ